MRWARADSCLEGWRRQQGTGWAGTAPPAQGGSVGLVGGAKPASATAPYSKL